MAAYEYMVVPAPKKAAKARGLRGTETRFAHALSELINGHAAEGWEYQRAEKLVCEERSGIFGKTSTVQHVLVFRRALPEDPDAVLGTAPEDDPFYRHNMMERAPTPEAMAAELSAAPVSVAPVAAPVRPDRAAAATDGGGQSGAGEGRGPLKVDSRSPLDGVRPVRGIGPARAEGGDRKVHPLRGPSQRDRKE